MIDDINNPTIELEVRSKTATSGRDVASVLGKSVRGERVEITASFENASEKNNAFHELNMNDETRGNIPDKISELSISRTQFDRQSRTHHRITWHISGGVFNILLYRSTVSKTTILFYECL